MHNDKHHPSQRTPNSARIYNNTGSKNPIININNDKEKSNIEIRYSK